MTKRFKGSFYEYDAMQSILQLNFFLYTQQMENKLKNIPDAKSQNLFRTFIYVAAGDLNFNVKNAFTEDTKKYEIKI